MSSTALLKRFESDVELTPVLGTSHIHVIRPKPSESPTPAAPEMTEADWDQFEADIHEAFEQLP